ncbi:MAG: hypothetical protein ACRC62_23005 [Microcoleus sp.]
MDLNAFKTFVVKLIQAIISKGDDRAAKDAVTIAKLSADAAELKAKVDELTAALAAADAAKVAEIAAVVQGQADALNVLSSELEAQFNPTPVADAVAEVVKESPEVVTPPAVEAATTIGEATPTEPAVVEAAVEAIEAAAE